MEAGIKICEETYGDYLNGNIFHFFQDGDQLANDDAYIIFPAS